MRISTVTYFTQTTAMSVHTSSETIPIAFARVGFAPIDVKQVCNV